MHGKRRITTGNRPWCPGRLAVFAGLAVLTVILQGCAIVRPYHPLPAALEDQAQIPGLPGVRAWGDEHNKSLEQSAIESFEQEKAANHGQLEPLVYVLALSGGGAEGAFGAGILCGWTETGTRPRFKLVTGVSTGALIAPFAFLGPKYDGRLKDFYTNTAPHDIVERRSLLAAITSDAIADNRPLWNRVAREVDRDLLDAGMIFATGFAPFRGGPLHHVGTLGDMTMYRKLQELTSRYGSRFTPDLGWNANKE